MDIALISSISFYIGIKRRENEFFTTSLYKINRIINKKQRSIKAANKSKANILRRTVPLKYYDLINVFSKKESNKLLLYYLYNHKIKLIGDILLGYYSLYY